MKCQLGVLFPAAEIFCLIEHESGVLCLVMALKFLLMWSENCCKEELKLHSVTLPLHVAVQREQQRKH